MIGRNPFSKTRRIADVFWKRREEWRSRRWTERDLEKRPKTAAAKVKLAVRLRGETVMTLAWIAPRLQMGSRHTVAHCLKGQRRMASMG